MEAVGAGKVDKEDLAAGRGTRSSNRAISFASAAPPRTCFTSVQAKTGTATAARAAGRKGARWFALVKSTRQGTARQDTGDDHGLDRVVEPTAAC